MTWPNADQLAVLISDLFIVAAAVGVPLALHALWRGRWSGRRRSWRTAVTVVLVLGFLVTAYGAFIEPRMLVVKEYRVDLRGGGEESGRKLRLAVVSDTHLGLFKGRSWADRLVVKINSLNPDAVLLAGDMVSAPSGFGDFAAFDGLHPALGSYAVLGNWDYHIGAVDVRRGLGSHGVATLVNRSVELNGLRLVGIDGIVYGNPDWDKALSEVGEGEPWITMVHNPDGALWAGRLGSRLTISGHTHGGQIRLPFVGPVPRLPTWLGQDYDRGLFDLNSHPLLITSGAGESSARIRLFQPPEIVLLEIDY